MKTIISHIATALVTIELVARLSTWQMGTYIHQPFVVSQRIGTPGIINENRSLQWISNERGRRGELYHGQPQRIAVLGSSTTSGVFLDQEESWPERLTQQLGRDEFHVDNYAIDGGTEYEATIVMEDLIKRGERYDIVLIMTHLALANRPNHYYSLDWQSTGPSVAVDLLPRMLSKQIRREPHLRPMLRSLRDIVLGPPPVVGFNFANRQLRNSGTIRLVYSPKSVDLKASKISAMRLLNSAMNCSDRVILLTHPIAFSPKAHPGVAAKWHALDPIDDDENTYRDNRSVAEAVRSQQQAMADAARSLGVEVCELDQEIEPLLEKSASLFDDKWHPAPDGAAIIGKIVADQIRSNPEYDLN